ncbi:MAG: hypothetical protein PHS99_09475 [Candidatus Marinimicrobia bacterium]|nr:hypothetical protein [Candidatus Neomarinimicrobiota bacterium]
MSKKIVNNLIYALSLVIVIIIFYELFTYVDRSLLTFVFHHPLPIFLSFLSLLIFCLIIAFIWSFIIVSFNGRMNLISLMTIRSQGEFGKYLPGKVWNLAFISYSAKKKFNVKTSRSLSVSMIEFYLSGFILVLTILVSFKSYHAFRMALGGVGIVSFLFLGYYFKNYRVFLFGLFFSAIAWFFAFLGFYVLVFNSGFSFSFLQTSGYYSVGQLGGMIAFFVPAGLGVREMLIVKLSGNSSLANCVILFRVLCIIAESVRYGILIILRRKYAS